MFLVEEETRGRVGTSGRVEALVKALLLPTLDLLTGFYLSSLFCSMRLVKRLTQKLWQLQDP